MVAISTITEFINRHLAAAEKIALREFIIQFQAQFYPEQDISFMDYFLELSKKENERQFIVHHDKLFEYGITKSNQSNHVKERLDKLSMSENEDYLVTKLRENSQNGGRPKVVYMLTPECFKTILIGATKHSSHTVDVLKYKKYYIFLEKAVNYYMDYQHLVDEAEKRFKDGTIGDLRNDIQRLTTINLDQTSKIDQLMVYAADTNATVNALDLSHKRKSHLSTVVLANKKLENYYGSTMMLLFTEEDNLPYIRVQNMRCQRKDLLPKMTNNINGTYTTNKNIPFKTNHCIAIPPIYFPNAVTLLIKVVERFEKIVRKQKISEYNKACADEIKAGSVERLTIKNFPVKMTRLYFEYYPNNVMTFNEMIMMVVDLIKQSQGCALDLPATKQLQMLSDKQQKLIEKRFNKNGSAAQEELLKEVNADIAQAARDLKENIFKGVFELPSSSEESNQDEDSDDKTDNEASDSEDEMPELLD